MRSYPYLEALRSRLTNLPKVAGFESLESFSQSLELEAVGNVSDDWWSMFAEFIGEGLERVILGGLDVEGDGRDLGAGEGTAAGGGGRPPMDARPGWSAGSLDPAFPELD